MDLQSHLDFATDLAYRAGRITLAYFNAGVLPDFKPDDTPVTVADRAAEQFIRGEIEKAYPGSAIVGEEYGETIGDGQSLRWIVDPIVGTKSFIHGVPLYGVLIGLEIEGTVRVGAAYYPGTDEMLCAADGQGCWWNGRRAHVSPVESLRHACICYTTPHGFERQSRIEAWDRVQKAAYMVRGWSDSYGYLLVATGRAEAMLDPVVKVWDCGPFPVILREAGGFFGDWAGEEGHLHPEALGANRMLLPELLELIKGP